MFFIILFKKPTIQKIKKNKIIKQYSKEKLEKELSLASFSELVAKITIKYKYGYILSNFYSPFL